MGGILRLAAATWSSLLTPHIFLIFVVGLVVGCFLGWALRSD
jgi:hypothetical protein